MALFDFQWSLSQCEITVNLLPRDAVQRLILDTKLRINRTLILSVLGLTTVDTWTYRRNQRVGTVGRALSNFGEPGTKYFGPLPTFVTVVVGLDT